MHVRCAVRSVAACAVQHGAQSHSTTLNHSRNPPHHTTQSHSQRSQHGDNTATIVTSPSTPQTTPSTNNTPNTTNELPTSEDDIDDVHREIAALAGCRSPFITRYHGAAVRPGSSELLIVMELLACSVADLVRARNGAKKTRECAGGDTVCAPASPPLIDLPNPYHILTPSHAWPQLASAPLPEPAIAYVLRAVASALAYLHAEGRIHRDVKAAK